MSLMNRPLAVLLAAIVMGAGVQMPGSPASAAPVPVSPVFGATIEDYSDYEPENTCNPGDKPGPVAVRELLIDTYGPASFGISRSCVPGGSSGHYEGRALDWMRDSFDPAERDQVETFLDWLLATDEHGNRHAMARRMGIHYLIWDREIWRAYDSPPVWEPYYGSSPHTDHLHISFS
ncbi:hypothetical protein BH20ACT5_BH20ACT5_01400 [soil metagenome]